MSNSRNKIPYPNGGNTSMPWWYTENWKDKKLRQKERQICSFISRCKHDKQEKQTVNEQINELYDED